MLRSAAGASAAGLVAGSALAALPATAASRPGQPTRRSGRPAAADPDTAAGPLVIHLRDAGTGEMDIFAGTSRTRLHDRALAAQLIRASQ
jgi:hypothetical protein